MIALISSSSLHMCKICTFILCTVSTWGACFISTFSVPYNISTLVLKNYITYLCRYLTLPIYFIFCKTFFCEHSGSFRMPIQLDIEELKLSFGLVPIKTDLLCLTRAAGFTKRKCLIFRGNPVNWLDNCLVFLGVTTAFTKWLP